PYVEQRGFTVISSGRLLLRSRDRLKLGTTLPGEPIAEAASFVTYVRQGPVQAGPGTFIKVPWSSTLVDPLAVMSLNMSFRNLIGPKPATWWEELFWGRRYVLTAGFGDVGSLALPLYPLYFEHRDRLVHLAREFSLVIVSFADSDHLRIEEIAPASATRRLSRVRAGAELVSMPLVAAEGITPQLLKVQFSYFSGRIAWRPILVSLVLLMLGNLAGFILLSKDVARFVRTRLHVRRGEPVFVRDGGVMLPRDVIDQERSHGQALHLRRSRPHRAWHPQAQGHQDQPRAPVPPGQGGVVAVQPGSARPPDRVSRRSAPGIQRRNPRSGPRHLRARGGHRYSGRGNRGARKDRQGVRR